MSLEKKPGGFRSRAKGEKRAPAFGNRPVTPRPTRYQPGGDPRALGDVDLARAVAFDVLYRVNVEGTYANLALPKALTEYRLKRRDAAFATEITYGTLRVQGILDIVIAHCSSRPLDSIDPAVLSAIRLGAYQLLYTRVEPHAAVDSAVKIVAATGNEQAKGFANGILRKISRTTPEAWWEKLQPADELAAIAFRHAHPEWVARSFEQALGGRDELDAALAADSERPIVHLVARPGEITAEELALMTGGDEGTYSPYAVYLPGGDPGRIDAVRDGLAAVQDEGSQLIARALTEAPLDGPDGGHWLDLCAGPGGKAALLGAIARIESATVDAVEVQPHRAKLIQQTVRDLPVTVHTMDGRNPSFEYQFDRVLVDAPCSGLGALRRRPEARWRKQESDIAQLAQLQYELLTSAINLTRPGGVIIYSTCSPDLRETCGVVNKALENHPVVELDAHPLVPNMENAGEEKSVQMWPHRHHTDAMFFAVLKKTPEKLG